MTILIVGAGPSGSYLATLLSNSGLPVTLVERLKNSKQNAFSSAVVPIDSITNGLIPYQSISSFWNSWQIYDPEKNLIYMEI